LRPPTDSSSTRRSASVPVIGVCGGVGAGKSAVAAAFARRGAETVDADRLAHRALDVPAVRDALTARFGGGVIDDEGRIDRGALRARVFGPGPEKRAALRDLEAVVHPVVRRGLHDAVEAARRRSQPPPLILLDVPLLTEGDLADACDAVVFVDAPEAERRARTARTRGWTADEHAAREAAQSSLAEKRARAAYVIVNDGDLAALDARVADLFPRLAAVPPRSNGPSA